MSKLDTVSIETAIPMRIVKSTNTAMTVDAEMAVGWTHPIACLVYVTQTAVNVAVSTAHGILTVTTGIVS